MKLELLFSLLLLTCLTHGQLNHDSAFLTSKILNNFYTALKLELASQTRTLTANEPPRHNGKLEFKRKEIPLLNLYQNGLHIKWATQPSYETLRKQTIETSWYQTGETIQQTPGTPLQTMVYSLKQTWGQLDHTGSEMHQLLRLRRQTMNRSPNEVVANPPSEQQSRRQQVLQRIFQTPTQEHAISRGNNVSKAITEPTGKNTPQNTMQTFGFLGQGTPQQQERIPRQMFSTQIQPSTGLFLTRGEHPLAWTNRQAVGAPTGLMPGTLGQTVGRPGPHPVQAPGRQIVGSFTNGQQTQALAPITSNQLPFSFQTVRSPMQQIPQRGQRPLTRTSLQQIFRTPIHQTRRDPNGQVAGRHGQQFTGSLSQQTRSLPNSIIMNPSPRSNAAVLPFALIGTRSISPSQQTRFIASPALTGAQTISSRSTSANRIVSSPLRNGITALGPIFAVLPGQDFGGGSRVNNQLDQRRHISSPFSSGSPRGAEVMGMDTQNNFAMDSSARQEFLPFLQQSRANIPRFDMILDGQSTSSPIWSGGPAFSLMAPEGFGPLPGVQLGSGLERPFLQPMLDMSLGGFGHFLGESNIFTPW